MAMQSGTTLTFAVHAGRRLGYSMLWSTDAAGGNAEMQTQLKAWIPSNSAEYGRLNIMMIDELCIKCTRIWHFRTKEQGFFGEGTTYTKTPTDNMPVIANILATPLPMLWARCFWHSGRASRGRRREYGGFSWVGWCNVVSHRPHVLCDDIERDCHETLWTNTCHYNSSSSSSW